MPKMPSKELTSIFWDIQSKLWTKFGVLQEDEAPDVYYVEQYHINQSNWIQTPLDAHAAWYGYASPKDLVYFSFDPKRNQLLSGLEVCYLYESVGIYPTIECMIFWPEPNIDHEPILLLDIMNVSNPDPIILDINAKDSMGCQLIHYAAYAGNLNLLGDRKSVV